MKSILIVLLLLIPVVYAQDNVLEAKKASLDVRGSEFILQMNLAFDYSKNKNTTITDLESTKKEFETKLNEALNAKSANELETKLSELKTIAKKFKNQLEEAAKDSKDELKNEIKTKLNSEKEKIKDKIKKADETKRKILSTIYDEKIKNLNATIEKEKKEGKEGRIFTLLLNKFEKAKKELNQTEFTSSSFSIGSGSEIFSKTISAAKDALNFLIDKIKLVSDMK